MRKGKYDVQRTEIHPLPSDLFLRVKLKVRVLNSKGQQVEQHLLLFLRGAMNCNPYSLNKKGKV